MVVYILLLVAICHGEAAVVVLAVDDVMATELGTGAVA